MVTQTLPDVLTPEQVATYLQIDPDTVRELIRDERLIASQIGDDYRVQKRHVDLLLWTSQTRPDITLREYTDAEIEAFLKEDKLDDEARDIVEQFTRMMDANDTQ